MVQSLKDVRENHFPEHQIEPQSLQVSCSAKKPAVVIRHADACIHSIFETQAEQTPEVVAAVYGKETLTYHDLNALANRLAHYLRSLGVGLETCVGVHLERSLELVISVLAILKAGGTYVPLDPAYPEERLSFIIQDAQLSVLLTQAPLPTASQNQMLTTVCLATAWPQLTDWPSCNVPSGVEIENLAYILYTSGSTGWPKGVCCTHRNVINLLIDFQQRWPLLAEDRYSLWTSFNFDVSVYEIFSALLTGGTLYLVPEEVRLDGRAFFNWLSAQQIQNAYIPPFMLVDFRDWLQTHAPSCALKRLLVGVEPISERLLLEIQDCLPALHIINGYGPTETTICATLYPLASRMDDTRNTPIGRPVRNTQVYLLDQHLSPVLPGQTGEIYIGGEGVARGYFHRPGLTAERFIPDPFSAVTGARLYKTGDMARELPDGNIEFLGRRDHQIKLRGFRIELGEVETVLRHHPAVRDVAVIVRENTQKEKHLVAYVVVKERMIFSHQLFRVFLQQSLPEYMIPTTFVQLDVLPLTPSGKIDRQALPAPEYIHSYVAPQNSLEQKLADMWETLFGVNQVGIYENFFELGGHSLLAAQFIARLRHELQVDIPLRSLFDNPSIAALAQVIAAPPSPQQTVQLPPIRPVDRENSIPLSFPQERIWLLQQLEPTNRSYHFQALLHFTGHLNIAALEYSLNEIIRRHEILRTTFTAVAGEPVQLIHPPFQVQLPVIDLSTLAEDERAIQAQRSIKEQVNLPFDLAMLPLIRWLIIQESEQDYTLVHVEHHIIHDGWSFNVFLGELQALYTAHVLRTPPPLSELSIQFADFAAWQRQWMQGEVAAAQLGYWKQKLLGCPPLLELPTDRPRPAVQTFRGASQRVELPVEICETLRTLSNREGTTLFMTMLAVFATLLSHYSQQEDICIGSGIANRRLKETEQLIGMIINTLVLRINTSGNPTFRDLLSQVRETTLEAQSYQDLPLDKIVEALRPERSLSHNPLFQVMFAFHDSPLPELHFPGLEFQLTEGISNGSAKFDLSLIAIPRAEQQIGHKGHDERRGITLVWEYNTDLFDKDTIDRFITQYHNLLGVLGSHPEQRILDLDVMTQPERFQVLEQWNATQAVYPDEKCVHELFEMQVARVPDALAIVSEEGLLTYHELNQRANQLAHRLQRLAVGPEVTVAICVDAPTAFIVGLLGVLKAGGAYVPLDPTLPTERLALLLEDAHVAVLLTQQHLAAGLPPQRAHTIFLDTKASFLAGEETCNLSCHIQGDNLAYIVYTSGSTGKPKGVQVTQRSLLNLIFWYQRSYHIQEKDRTTQLANTAFDACMLEIWPYLTAGASLYAPSKETRLSPVHLQDWLLAQHITISFLPTPLAEQMLTLPWPATTSLRFLLTGGDTLSSPPETSYPFTLVNLYGPTESTVVTTAGVFLPEAGEERAPSIGRPIANTQVYLLNASLHPVPPGVVGELYIGGQSVARGYFRRPALSAERFIPNPFSAEPGARLYKTGDLARYLPDGRIEFLGRIDHQVKLRGFRIELGEIEYTLGQHPSVQEALVLAIQQQTGRKSLVAYITPRCETTLREEELRSFLKERLPDYMIPSAFLCLESLPLTPNGKVDRHALALLGQERAVQRNCVTPRNTLELRLTEMFEEALALSPVGVTDDFFALGGHSLLAVRLMGRIKEHFGRDLPLSILFREATVERLAAVLQRAADAQLWSPLVGIQPRGSKPPFFWIHPAGGAVLRYLPLARALGPDQPSYALEESFFNADWQPRTSIEEMASRYAREIRAFQPQGPYFLGGHSMGGIIAFEIARKLQQEGMKTAFLALLDTLAPLPCNQREEEDDTSLIAWYARTLLRDFSQKHPTTLLPSLLTETALRQCTLDEQFDYLLDVAKRVHFVPPDTDAMMLRRLMQINIAHVQASWNYTPSGVYPGKLTLFRATERLAGEEAGSLNDPTLGWSTFTSQPVEIYVIPGSTHRTQIEEPYVQLLAEYIKACLAREQGNQVFL